MLYNASFQLAEHMVVNTTVAVYKKARPTMLIGNDLMGGANAKLKIVGMNA